MHVYMNPIIMFSFLFKGFDVSNELSLPIEAGVHDGDLINGGVLPPSDHSSKD